MSSLEMEQRQGEFDLIPGSNEAKSIDMLIDLKTEM